MNSKNIKALLDNYGGIENVDFSRENSLFYEISAYI